MARTVCASEFPDFDLMNAFNVFKLSDNRSIAFNTTTVQEYRSTVNTASSRLATFFSKDEDEYVRQYRVIYPVAHNFKKSTPNTSVSQAFSLALAKLRRTDPCLEIRRSLEAFSGWEYATS